MSTTSLTAWSTAESTQHISDKHEASSYLSNPVEFKKLLFAIGIILGLGVISVGIASFSIHGALKGLGQVKAIALIASGSAIEIVLFVCLKAFEKNVAVPDKRPILKVFQEISSAQKAIVSTPNLEKIPLQQMLLRLKNSGEDNKLPEEKVSEKKVAEPAKREASKVYQEVPSAPEAIVSASSLATYQLQMMFSELKILDEGKGEGKTLPKDIKKLLSEDCPFVTGSKVYQTHTLVFVDDHWILMATDVTMNLDSYEDIKSKMPLGYEIPYRREMEVYCEIAAKDKREYTQFVCGVYCVEGVNVGHMKFGREDFESLPNKGNEKEFYHFPVGVKRF